MLHPFFRLSTFRLSTAATVCLTIALPIRELRADHGSATAPAFATSAVGATACTAGSMLPGRVKRTTSLLVEIWAQLKALAQRLAPSDAAEDVVQEALARALAAGVIGTLSLGTVICFVSRRRRAAEAPRDAAAPAPAIAPTTADTADDLPADAGTAQPEQEEEELLALGNYLRSIVRNVAREQWRQAKRVRTIAPEVADDTLVTAEQPAAAAIEAESGAELRHQLDRLGPREREVVMLHAQLDHTFPEIGAQLGISTAAATKCWQRVVRRMRTDPCWRRLADA